MSILRECQVLVCASYAEGMPNVILEGMASGCAVIASDVGAVSLMVNSENGWLIEPGNFTAIKDAMLQAISSSPQELLNKRSLSLQRVRTAFIWEIIIDKTVSSFYDIIAETQSAIKSTSKLPSQI